MTRAETACFALNDIGAVYFLLMFFQNKKHRSSDNRSVKRSIEVSVLERVLELDRDDQVADLLGLSTAYPAVAGSVVIEPLTRFSSCSWLPSTIETT